MINRGEWSGRFDADFHKYDYKILEDKINNSQWRIKKLMDICKINRGGSPRPIHKFITKDDNGVNWIKIGDTKNINKYIYKTKEQIKQSGVSHSRLVKEGDFILSNSMSFGKPYIMKTTGCIHDGWLLLRKHTNEISEDFLYTILSSDFMYQSFKRVTIGGVVENLSIDLVKRIKIPVPPIEEQNKIIELLDDAIILKEKKEQEAKDLHNSIDDYLLDKLGITLPDEPEDNIENRTFKVGFDDIFNDRLDANSYTSYYQNIFIALEKSTTTFTTLKMITKKIKTGTTPSQKLNPYTEDKDNIPFLRNTNIQNGEIISDKFKYIKNELSKHLTFSYKDEVIICIAGTIGITALNTYEKLSINQNVSSLTIDKSKININFLMYWLNTKVSINLMKRLASIATISYINNPTLLKLQIPIPDFKIQNEIATEISKRRHRARKLNFLASKTLEKAKKEVENIILGVDSGKNKT